MSDSNQQFCLKWNNHHTNLLTVFETLLHSEAFTDVTLAVDGASIRCHKMVLAACSGYFHTLFCEHVANNVIVVLKDVRPEEMRCLLEYMYRGEVHVEQEQFSALLSLAESLQIKGLVEEGRRERQRASQTVVNGVTPAGQGAGSSASEQQVSITETTSRSNMDSAASPGASQPAACPPQQSPASASAPSLDAPPASIETSAGSGSAGLPLPDLPKRRRKATASGSGHELWYENNPILRTVLGHGGVSGLDVSTLMAAAMRRELIERECTERQVMSSTGSEENHTAPEAAGSEPESDKLSNGSVGDVPAHWDPNLSNYIGNYIGFAPSAMRPEWKRYKQYSKSDLQQALDAVKGGMTALQASRKFHVPSRTLYDKIKKLGIPTTPRRYPRSPGAPVPSSPVSLFSAASTVAPSIRSANGDSATGSRHLQPIELSMGRRGEPALGEEAQSLVHWPKQESRNDDAAGGSDAEADEADEDNNNNRDASAVQRQPMELVVDKRRATPTTSQRRADGGVPEFRMQWPKEESGEDTRELDVVA